MRFWCKALLFAVLLVISTASTFAHTCRAKLSHSTRTTVSKENPQLRAFLVEVITSYRKGFRSQERLGPNENLKHIRRLVNDIRNAADEIRSYGMDPAILEVGIYLSDVAKNPEVAKKYLAEYGGNAFKVFLDHARLAIVEGTALKEKHSIDDKTWGHILEVIIGHDGPALAGSWWDENYTRELGEKYPNILKGSMYGYVHAMLDRMDQGGVFRDHRNIYQGGVRKISFEMLGKFVKEKSTDPLADTIRYSLTNIYAGSSKQVNHLLNRQAEYFPHGIPLFLFHKLTGFVSSGQLSNHVGFESKSIIFVDKNGNTQKITQVGELYKVPTSETLLSASDALTYFWENF